MPRIVIKIDNNVPNKKRISIWKQPGFHDDLSAEKFAEFCSNREEALRIVERLLAQIPIAHYPPEAEEAYRKLTGASAKDG